MVEQTTLETYDTPRPKPLNKLNTRESLIYTWLKKYGPCTTRELHRHIVEDEGVTSAALEGPNYVKPRVSELRKKGYILSTEKRKCTVSGVTASLIEANQ